MGIGTCLLKADETSHCFVADGIIVVFVTVVVLASLWLKKKKKIKQIDILFL